MLATAMAGELLLQFAYVCRTAGHSPAPNVRVHSGCVTACVLSPKTRFRPDTKCTDPHNYVRRPAQRPDRRQDLSGPHRDRRSLAQRPRRPRADHAERADGGAQAQRSAECGEQRSIWEGFGVKANKLVCSSLS